MFCLLPVDVITSFSVDICTCVLTCLLPVDILYTDILLSPCNLTLHYSQLSGVVCLATVCNEINNFPVLYISFYVKTMHKVGQRSK